MDLEFSTWPEIERYLKRRTDIIIPIGSTEQHGPMGLIGTDSICPEVIAKTISETHDILVAPTIKLGMSQHHLCFPGSITLRPATLIAVVQDVVRSLITHGFTHLFFLNGHGGNVAPVTTAFSEIYTDHSLAQDQASVHLHLWSWFSGTRVRNLSDLSFGEANGSHATPSELSLSFYAFPDKEKREELSPAQSTKTNFRDCYDFKNNFPDGRMGADSSLATAALGKKFHEFALEDFLEEYQDFYQV
ncbi:MAG: creatininase family protein [Desulfobulbaceae bacterium]|nr:MAG: creatininase family protein [Desulfobulbaceae bacterium]